MVKAIAYAGVKSDKVDATMLADTAESWNDTRSIRPAEMRGFEKESRVAFVRRNGNRGQHCSRCSAISCQIGSGRKAAFGKGVWKDARFLLKDAPSRYRNLFTSEEITPP
jgi:hypothetical protein